MTTHSLTSRNVLLYVKDFMEYRRFQVVNGGRARFRIEFDIEVIRKV